MDIVVSPGGLVRCVYDETIDLRQLGLPHIRRASHVEPDSRGQWFADLAPSDGPRLGPFDNRSEALTAERQWLVVHWLIRPQRPGP